MKFIRMRMRLELRNQAASALASESRLGEFATRTSALHEAAVLAAGEQYNENDEDDEEDVEDVEDDDNTGMNEEDVIEEAMNKLMLKYNI
jgi:hypothetical protein